MRIGWITHHQSCLFVSTLGVTRLHLNPEEFLLSRAACFCLAASQNFVFVCFSGEDGIVAGGGAVTEVAVNRDVIDDNG